MLVLTRKVDESITIGNDITITILEIKRNQVRIGIDAPKDTSVHRTEIYHLIVEENLKASQLPQGVLQLPGQVRGKK